MKLRPLDPTHRLARDMLAFARRARLLEALEQSPSIHTDILIVVANGNPENRVMLAIAHVLDGQRVVDIAFPEHKHFSILNVVHEYVKRGYRKVIVVLDQEEMELSNIHERVKQRVVLPIKDYVVDQDVNGRLVCIESDRATLYVVINGVEDPRFVKHTIEDHLLRLAEELGKHRLQNNVDPKQEWRRLSKDRQREVLTALAKNRELVKKHFRQHLKALAKTLTIE